MALNHAKISIRDLYKVFGHNPKAALQQVLQGMGKSDLLADHGHVLGLKDINLDIGEGEITVIMGLSGSGKSTLIRHLNRLIEPTSGEILVDGSDVTKMDDRELRQLRQSAMSMVFQKFALLPHRTVLENAGMALWVRGENTDKEARKCLERVGLGGFENYYPQQLSGGMQQRVGLARALASNSDIMLMDEAFSALDPLIRTDMQNLLLELQRDLKKTIVFVTHDLDEALKLADYLTILKDGYVVQKGNPQDIILNPSDRYIEDFVQDINRLRVLQVSSIMQPLKSADGLTMPTIDHNQTLETALSRSGGDTEAKFLVTSDERPVGTIDMKHLFKALVPRVASL